MLILSRKAGEGLVFTCPDGTRIDVTVTEIRRMGTSRPVAKIGIGAPQSVLIRRDELSDLHVYTKGQKDVADSDSDG